MADVPDLALTPVDAAMQDHTVGPKEHDAYTAASAPSHLGGPGVDAEMADRPTVVPSIESQAVDPGLGDIKMPHPAPGAVGGGNALPSTAGFTAPVANMTAAGPAQSDVKSSSSTGYARVGPTAGMARPLPALSQPVTNPAPANMDSKMNASRAALIAKTPATSTSVQRTSTPNHVVGGGPKSSGENNTPLGQRKPSNSVAPTKVEAGGQSSSHKWINPTLGTSAAPGHGRTGSMTSLAGNSASAPADRAVVNAQRATSNTQKAMEDARKAPTTGPAAFGTQSDVTQMAMTTSGGNAPNGSTANGSTPTPAPSTLSYTMPASGNPGGAMKVYTPPTNKELQIWRTIEDQIREAVLKTKRAYKCNNGKNNRKDVNANVQKALDILRPIILGGPKVNSSAVSSPKPCEQSATILSMAQTNSEQPAQAQGPQGLPPPPPGGMMIFNWALGAWQWTWQQW